MGSQSRHSSIETRTSPDKVVPRSGSCSTQYVRRVSGDELFVFLDNQACELHDFLLSAMEDV